MPLDHNNSGTFLNTIRNSEMLTAEDERELVMRWQNQGDQRAKDRIIKAHMKIAVKFARKFKNYGHPHEDLVQEAAIGLVLALDRFDPDKGFRFSTYAVHWITCELRNYVLRNLGTVRVGKTRAQKKIFFKYRSARGAIINEASKQGLTLSHEAINKRVADRLEVSVADVELMAGSFYGTYSLDAPLAAGDEDDGSNTWLELLPDESLTPGEAFEHKQSDAFQRMHVSQALEKLSPREMDIISSRKMSDEPLPLSDLGEKYSVSRERIRQVESEAFKKISRWIEREAPALIAELA